MANYLRAISRRLSWIFIELSLSSERPELNIPFTPVDLLAGPTYANLSVEESAFGIRENLQAAT